MSRREFTPMVYAQIVHRASPGGVPVCEGCGLVLGRKPYHVDHTLPDALFLNKKRKLTVDDGKLLGVECCHAPKTAVDVAVIAKAKRREATHLNIKRPKQSISGAPFPKSEKPTRPSKPMPARRPIYVAVSVDSAQEMK